jgi:Amt family ammonium transporter
MVRRKNVLSTMMMSFVMLGLVGLLWVTYGYSLSFGHDIGGIIGGFDFFGLANVGQTPSPVYASTVPHLAFMIYQAMFAIITVALFTGAVVDRIKFSSLLVFSALWLTFIYTPVAHWVWGGGWLAKLGALDFAGGTVVHVNAGVTALALAMLLGPRKGIKEKEPMEAHNIPWVMLGAGLLWFGWFGFNAGSALAANGVAANAFVVTNISAAAAVLVWMLIDWILVKKPTMLGSATGAIAGLAAITPACGYVNVFAALLIGALSSFVCYFMIVLVKPKFGYDDSLDAFGVHGVGGTVGTIATGLFAEKAVNAAGNNGLLFGNAHQLLVQSLSLLVAVTFAVVMTFIIFKIVDALVGMRVEEKNEIVGLDLTQQSEAAYTVIE